MRTGVVLTTVLGSPRRRRLDFSLRLITGGCSSQCSTPFRSTSNKLFVVGVIVALFIIIRASLVGVLIEVVTDCTAVFFDFEIW